MSLYAKGEYKNCQQHQKSFDIAQQATKNGSKKICTFNTSSSQKWLSIDMYIKDIWLSVKALRI